MLSKGLSGVFSSTTDAMDINLGKLWEMARDSKAWSAAVHGVVKS